MRITPEGVEAEVFFLVDEGAGGVRHGDAFVIEQGRAVGGVEREGWRGRLLMSKPASVTSIRLRRRPSSSVM